MYVVKAHTYMYSYLSTHKIMHKLICAQVHTVPGCMYTCYFTEQSKHSTLSNMILAYLPNLVPTTLLPFPKHTMLLALCEITSQLAGRLCKGSLHEQV